MLALGRPSGRGHGGHTLKSEGFRTDHVALEGFGNFGLKPQMKWFAGLGLKTQGKDLRAAHGIIGELVLSQNDFMKDSWSSEHGRSTLTILSR